MIPAPVEAEKNINIVVEDKKGDWRNGAGSTEELDGKN